jgi:hypothetical protein
MTHVKRLVFVGAAVALALTTAYAQEHDHAAMTTKTAKPAPAKAAAVENPEVFCGTMKTGQLCSHGTTSLLGLSPEKSAAWLAAVRQYNKDVNSAIVALQAQAKANLSAEQVAEVNRWFAIGINPQINQLLASSSTKASGGK